MTDFPQSAPSQLFSQCVQLCPYQAAKDKTHKILLLPASVPFPESLAQAAYRFSIPNSSVGLFSRKRYIEPTCIPYFFNPPMWRPSQTILRWVPSAVALALLAACSQPLPDQTADAPSPIAAQPETFSTPTPSVTPSGSSLPKSPTSAGQPKPIAPVPAKMPPAPIASASPTKALPLERTPTFRATPRMAGFSPDSNYFIYLESSRDTGAGVPKSVLQLVDVASNRCVENGCIETRYGEKEAETHTAEAETDLLKQTWKVRQDLNLTPPIAGTEIPILSRSRAVDGSETVTIRLHNSQPLQLRLRQKSTQDRASMQLRVNYNGQERSLDSLNNFRDYVLDYSIRQVTLSPDGKRVAVLITATKPTFEGTLGTTIVQGFAL